MGVADIIALIAITVTLFGLLVAIRGNNKQLSAQSFIAYTEKYDSLIEEMPNEVWNNRNVKDYPFPDNDDDLSKKLHAYLHLCSQEFYLYIKGLVEVQVWKIWEIEIEHNLCSPLLVKEWPKHSEYFKLYPEFHEYVQRVQDVGPGHNCAPAYNKAFHWTAALSRRRY